MEMISEAVYLHYLDSLLEGNKKQCLNIVNSLADSGVPIKEIFINVFQRSMYRVGQMWEKERCTVAEEHIATKITESLIEQITSKYDSKEKLNKTVVITCIDKEFHEIGARMVAGFFEVNGWSTYYLGSNTPHSCLLKLIDDKKPDVLGISINFYVNIPRLIKLIEEIKAQNPDQQIIVGGQALGEGHSEILNEFPDVTYLASLDELEKFILNESLS
jgi:methanogenic corrinoid protein MtbC1